MDDSRSEVQIIEYLSECLRIFRKRLMQMVKISHKGSSQSLLQAEQHFQKTSQQALQLLKQSPKIFSNLTKPQNVFSRFSSRVKQIVNNTQLKSTSVQISKYLLFLSTLLKEAMSAEKCQIILKHMLGNSPKGFPNHNPIQIEISSEKSLYTIENSPISIKKCQKSVKSGQKTEKYLENYEKFINCLEKQYFFFKGLDLDESEYRRKFFIARQDHHRKDTNLYQDMLFRNRLTQQIMTNYKNSFDRYSQKLELKKNRPKQSPQKKRNLIKQQPPNSTTKQQIIKLNQSDKMIETTISGYSFKNPGKRLKTDKDFISRAEMLKAGIKGDNKSNIFFPRGPKLKTQFATCMSTDEIFANQRPFQSEKIKINSRLGGANLMQLKKINFLGSKIELVPENEHEKDMIRIERKKNNLCKRTQQHLKKKISIVSQPKAMKSKGCLNTISPKKYKNLSPFLIDYSRLLHK